MEEKDKQQPQDIDAIENELDTISSSEPVAEIEAEDEETKIPVSYENAEEALLSMFIQDDDVATLVAQSGLRDTHLLKRKNRLLFPLLLDVRLKRGACNYNLLADACEKEVLPDNQTLLDSIGGLPELTKIMGSAPEVIDLKVAQAYIDLVFEQYRLSKVKESARWIVSQKKFDEAKLVDKLSSIQQILVENVNKYGLVGLDDLLIGSYEKYKDKKANPINYEGIRTGFYWLDKYKAVAKKRLCVIGARTGVGKSVLAGNMVTNMILSGSRVLLFTPELDKDEYIDRLLCSYSGVEKDKWTAATVSDLELDRISNYRDKLISVAPRNLFIEDRGSQTCSFIINSVKRHMLNHKVDVVIVDYLQKLRYYGDNTKRAITDIMEKFGAFAKDNSVAFIVVSQLRRSDNPEPQMNELKESGDIENFADCVILLHRNSTFKMGERNKGWYKIEKNRQGRNSDCVELTYDENCLKFSEVNLPEDGLEAYDSFIPDEERSKLPTEKAVMEMVDRENGNKGQSV